MERLSNNNNKRLSMGTRIRDIGVRRINFIDRHIKHERIHWSGGRLHRPNKGTNTFHEQLRNHIRRELGQFQGPQYKFGQFPQQLQEVQQSEVPKFQIELPYDIKLSKEEMSFLQRMFQHMTENITAYFRVTASENKTLVSPINISASSSSSNIHKCPITNTTVDYYSSLQESVEMSVPVYIKLLLYGAIGFAGPSTIQHEIFIALGNAGLCVCTDDKYYMKGKHFPHKHANRVQADDMVVQLGNLRIKVEEQLNGMKHQDGESTNINVTHILHVHDCKHSFPTQCNQQQTEFTKTETIGPVLISLLSNFIKKYKLYMFAIGSIEGLKAWTNYN